MEKIRQYINAVYMYAYLRYYRYKLRSDFRYMVKESLEHGRHLEEK